MKKNELTVGGVFGAAGAALLGAKLAGFQPVFNIEPRPFVTKGVMTVNFPGIAFTRDINEAKNLKADLVVGSPDCKIFSNLSTKTREKNRKITSDPTNNDLFRAIMWTANVIKPYFFIFENLPTLSNFLGFEYKKEWGESRIYDVNNPLIGTRLPGLAIQTIVLNSKDFGVAQSRKRLFIIGSSVELPKFDPQELSNEVLTSLEIMRYGETVGEAFQDLNHKPNNELPKHSLKRTKGFRGLKPGESYYGTQNNRRLHYDKPAWTVASSCSRFVHPTEPRTLTVRETARLMGWPDGFSFHGTTGQQLDQVGKSMVPQIPYAIAKYLKRNVEFINP